MCGIVGYRGDKNAVNIVLEGLTRLEYRGYDSAGICLKLSNGDLQQFKKIGKISNLKSTLSKTNPKSELAIGHTRWATHGKVTDLNAHPHGNELVNVVHNGIIENASELKKQLQKEGEVFYSETDSEVFVVLLTRLLKQGNNLEQACVKAFKYVEGNSAFVMMEKSTQKIVAIRRAAPLVCAQDSSSNDVFVSSDPYALVGFADQLIFPEDEVVCLLDPESEIKIQLLELDGSESKRFLSKDQDMDLEISDKGEFDHYMMKEIHEQPELIGRFLDFYFSGDGKDHLDIVKNLSPRLFHVSACGTALHAGLVIKNYIEKINKIPCHIDFASEFRYRNPLLDKEDLGLFISQSGETADTLAAQKLCKDNGLKTLSILNVEGSSMYRESDYNLLIKASTEIGVASTKAFTLMALTGFLFSHRIAGTDFKNIKNEIETLKERINELINRKHELESIAEGIYQKKGFLFTGRGKYFPIALEGALKLKEIAYVHAEGYAAGELKHGPIALIEDSMVNIAIIGPELYEKTRSNIEEVKARKGIIVSFGPENDESLVELSDYYFPLNFKGLDELSPLYVNVANQLLSYYVARFKGTDIDKPRNLAKSVTVE